MIDLKNFPKLGVRVPNSLKKRVGQYLLDHADDLEYVNGPMTIEGVFAVAAMAFLDLPAQAQAEAMGQLAPRVVALFEMESPSDSVAPETKMPADEAGSKGGFDLGSGGRVGKATYPSGHKRKRG